MTGRVSLEVGLTLNLRVVAVAAEGTVGEPISSAVGSIGGLTIDYNFSSAASGFDGQTDALSPYQIDMSGAEHLFGILLFLRGNYLHVSLTRHPKPHPRGWN